ncbi:MAG: sulfatase-like hydrolase/transferase, partial [Planctomycetota bacterium]
MDREPAPRVAGASIRLPAASAAVLLTLLAGVPASARTERPNFLVVMVDDLGFGDIGCHGGPTPTPNIDRLFSQGVRLGSFMTWCVCSPTRAGLLTGINPLRLDQGPNTDGDLPAATGNVGRAFRSHGYRTGIFGKWHNSVAPKFRPGAPHINDFGFDRWVGFYGGGIDFFTKIWPNKYESPCWYHDREEVNDEREYATDLLTKHATAFMAKSAAERRSFFCYLPYNTVHTPLHVLEKDLSRVPKEIVAAAGRLRPWREYYKLINDRTFGGRLSEGYRKLTGDASLDGISGKLTEAEQRLLYSAMIINLDDNIGRLMRFLDEQGLTRNTVVWFFSDNGATKTGRNLPFKGGKHSIWEGGIHSPAVVRWPAGDLTGPREYGGLTGYLDVYPTCAEMAGLEVPGADRLDGRACYRAIRGGSASPVEAYHFVYRDQDMIRTERWKLMRGARDVELYDIASDPGEERNVADAHPDLVARMGGRLDEWMQRHAVMQGHLPHRPSGRGAAPEGEVLEFSLRLTRPARGRARIVIPFSRPAGTRVRTGDRFEYDIYVARGSAAEGFHVSPTLRKASLLMTTKVVDDRRRRLDDRYSPADTPGRWERRAVGLAPFCPRPLAQAAVVLTASRPGEYRIYLDNVAVTRRDGSRVEFWGKGKPRTAKPPPGVRDLVIRPVAL